MKTEYVFEEWLSEVQKIEYSDYWNDESREISKEWWVIDGNFSKMELYLEKIHAVNQLEACVNLAEKSLGRKLNGIGADLAAGVLWATPHLLRLGAKKIYSVEYSRHRLTKLGFVVLEHYQIHPSQIVLALGDFHQINLSSNTLDFIFMSQAFHHSEKPRELLREVKRILKPEGIVIITGEHIVNLGLKQYIRQLLRFLLSKLIPLAAQKKLFGHTIQTNGLWPGGGDVFFVDNVLGDHHYTNSQYEKMFLNEGFQYHCLRNDNWHSQAFVLIPSS